MPPELSQPQAAPPSPFPDKSRTVLVVDDSVIDARIASASVERAGLHAVQVHGGREALDTLKKSQPAIILTDLVMPQLDGLRLVDEVMGLYPTSRSS